MSKEKIEKIFKTIPDAMKNIAGYIKGNFDKEGQEALNNSTGTIGLLIKIFAQDKIDDYFSSISEKKCENYGTESYIKACMIQASRSIEYFGGLAEEMILSDLLVTEFKSELIEFPEVNQEDLVSILNPIYHPIIIHFKTYLRLLLSHAGLLPEHSDIILKKFNSDIENTIVEVFGTNDYEIHLSSLQAHVYQNNEAKLLWDMVSLSKIGFSDVENLHYEETFASWQPVTTVNDDFDEKQQTNNDKRIRKDAYKKLKSDESTLGKAETLIEEHFSNREHTLDMILFAVADFGKGKSVFLKQLASKLAKKFVNEGEGYFPVYFNLRNFANYRSDTDLGVIDDFLQTEYGINIREELYKKKKYFFLMDSLDESGDLNPIHIEKVISSIKSIQSLDKTKNRNNRILISTRPFSSGLDNHLKSHTPFTITEDKKVIPYYLSIYGFKSDQFNHWLEYTLESHFDKAGNLTAISNNKFYEIVTSGNAHKALFEQGTLSLEELKRPIFVYMIYQLIINNIDFFSIGKIGVYLSFINLLSKDAKYVDDIEIDVDFLEEIKCRNILHSIASLWAHQRHEGKQGVLKKADICRVLERKCNGETDSAILERYASSETVEIKFLSHSYFGEKDNLLHFQHQSFAEILLAEYYLKIFIKYALDRKVDIEEARCQLNLDSATGQSLEFFKELVLLLKGTVFDNGEDVLEKRKLLLPLLASLAQEDNNPFNSDHLYYSWFSVADKNNLTTSLVERWPIGSSEIDKIVNLAVDIIESKNSILMHKGKSENSLYNEELTVINNQKHTETVVNFDKWLALLLGNTLITNLEEKVFFNQCLPDSLTLIEMCKAHQLNTGQVAPNWARNCFLGTKLVGVAENLVKCKYLNFDGIDFSFTRFENIDFSGSSFVNCNFPNSSILNCDFSFTDLRMSKTANLQWVERSRFNFSHILQGVLFPQPLAEIFETFFNNNHGCLMNESSSMTYINHHYIIDGHSFGSEVLHGFLSLALSSGKVEKQEIKEWFTITPEQNEAIFYRFIDTL